VSGANALTVEYPAGTTLADGTTTIESGIYKRNDIGAESLNASGDTLTGYAVKGSDGKFYEAEITAGAGFDANDPATWTDANLTLTVVGVDDGDGNTQAVEVSAGNIANTAAANDELVVRQEAISSNDDLRNLALDSAPTASGLYALKDGSGYVVKGSDDNYYQAAVDASGAVSWNSDTSPAIAESLIETGATVDNVKTGVVTVSLSGLADGETLLQGEDGQYFVSSENANGNMVYTKASVNGDTGEVTKLDGTQTVDALGTLDNALKAVDNLRSDLGAIQNRFESAITNLQTNETNLSAARSRIEDADYAAEVANMTRAQILQQAGTSVLAQANQIPQNVLSLLG
jgi:flagellin